MRKFARSIGSEGKVRENRKASVLSRRAGTPLLFGRSTPKHAVADPVVVCEGYPPEAASRAPSHSGTGRLCVVPSRGSAVASHKLPTQNCLRRGIQLYN